LEKENGQTTIKKEAKKISKKLLSHLSFAYVKHDYTPEEFEKSIKEAMQMALNEHDLGFGTKK